MIGFSFAVSCSYSDGFLDGRMEPAFDMRLMLHALFLGYSECNALVSIFDSWMSSFRVLMCCS